MSDLNNVRAVSGLKSNSKAFGDFYITYFDEIKALNCKMNLYHNGKLMGTETFKHLQTERLGDGNLGFLMQHTAKPFDKKLREENGYNTFRVKEQYTVPGFWLRFLNVEKIDDNAIKFPISVGKNIYLDKKTVLIPQKVEMVSTPAGNFKSISIDVISNQKKVSTIWVTDGFIIVKVKYHGQGSTNGFNDGLEYKLAK